MLPDGCLIHLGRKDFQMKIRGHRIEPAEIEIALLDLDDIKDAVVILREDRSGDKLLVAYLVPAMQPAPTVSTLRRILAEKLPDYMIPSLFVTLDALPLLPNGKVNRRALPAPSRARPELETPFAAPRIPLEEVIAKTWSQVLGLEEVGIHDNFFELGGHSLRATQIISRLCADFQIELPLRTLFEVLTVAELADVIVANEKKPGTFKKIALMLNRIEGMSKEDIEKALRAKRRERGNR